MKLSIQLVGIICTLTCTLACNKQQNPQVTAQKQTTSNNQNAVNIPPPQQQQQQYNNNIGSMMTNPINSRSMNDQNNTASPIDSIAAIKPTILNDTASCVQVAILLDTSNSMDGLIDQAKSQLWKIVNEIALARDKKGNIPQLLLALYDYGNDRYNAEKGYIKQIAPFTNDLDAISERLFALSTYGGSEFCGHVIQTAHNELTWSNNKNNIKIIYIAGNEEFTQGQVDYKTACKNAVTNGIVINTIFCGNYDEGVNTKWKDGADLADGKYLNIDQDQKIVHIDAPQDPEIQKLNNELNDTYIGYGNDGATRKAMQFQQDANAAMYGNANNAQRAVSKASAAYKNDSWDLVDAVKEKTVDLKTIDDAELPKEMKGMNATQREQYINKQSAKRSEIQAKIKSLDEERRKFVTQKEREMAENNPNAHTLDAVMLKSIREQLAAKGMTFKR